METSISSLKAEPSEGDFGNMTTCSFGSNSKLSTRSSEVEDDWEKRFPVKPPIFVIVTGIISPGKYWVREVPMMRQIENQPHASSSHARVREIELKLAKLYGNEAPKINPDNQIKDLKPEILVAVRKSYRSKHWYRGQIVSVMHKSEAEVVAKVK